MACGGGRLRRGRWLLAASLALLGCGANPEDLHERQEAPPGEAPRRVVVLAPAAAEMLDALGLEEIDELVVGQAFKELPPERVKAVGVTGSGGRLLAELLPAQYVNELVAQTRAVALYHPEARTVIEIGGQDSKLLVLEARDGRLVLVDFPLNSQCAAGTGSFLEQQAARLGITIEEFSELAAQARDPPYIAGRCAVFAKSDIVHLQQVGTPLREILGGLCMALARNFCSDVAQGRPFRRPILFQGGVSKNRGMILAFEAVLGLRPGELIVPEHHSLMGAIGAALIARAEAVEPTPLADLAAEWERYINGELPPDWADALPDFTGGDPLATRATSGKVLDAIFPRVPQLVGGSADLSGLYQCNFRAHFCRTNCCHISTRSGA